MTRSLLTVVLSASMASTTIAQTAQTPVRDPQAARAATATPPPSGRASIVGVVSSADASAAPIRMATVVLIGETTGTLKVSMTDASGVFRFRDLPADHYLVGASKRPYIGAVAGATRPARPGVDLVVAEAQAVANVSIKLTPGAAIAGTVIDDRGHPASSVGVIVKQWRTRGGERTLTNVPNGSAVTDDRGMYRVFGLAPGQYIVYAQPPAPVVGVPLRDADVDRALAGGGVAIPPTAPAREYAPVYAPGSTMTSADAMTIDLSPGDDREGVDMQLAFARLVKVDGTLIGADGQPVPAGILSASSEDAAQSSRAALVAAGGHFQMTLRPGAQTLQYMSRGAGPAQVGVGSIVVGDAEQSGVQIPLRPGLTMSGRIAFEGATPPPAMAGRQIPLHAVSPAAEAAHRTPMVLTNPAGAFTANNLLPGQYIVSGPLAFGASTDSITWTIRSVVAGGRDVTDLPIVLTADAPAPDLVVTLTDAWQSVSGKIEGALPNNAYTVVVFPSDQSYWIAGSRRIRTTRAGTDGTFALGGPGSSSLPAGSYLLALVTDIDTGEEFDPAFLDSIRTAATPITIAAGAKVTQNVRIR